MKLYIGGKQARPDSGYSMEVRASDGQLLGEAPLGNRKDIRNAVEAARKATAGQRPLRTIARRFFTTSPKIFRSGATRLRSRLAAVVGEDASRSGSKPRHRAHLFLRSVGGQV